MHKSKEVVGLPLPGSADLPLLARTGAPQFSAYLPTHTKQPAARQDRRQLLLLPERVRDLLLLHRGEFESHSEATAMASLRRLVEQLADAPAARAGIALFVSPTVSQAFRLARTPRQDLVVGDHFFLRPLLDALDGDWRCCTVAVTQKSFRLLTCDAHGVSSRADGLPSGSGGLVDDLDQNLRGIAAALRRAPEAPSHPLVVFSNSEIFDRLRKVAPELCVIHAGTSHAEHFTDRELGEMARGLCERAARDRHRLLLSEALDPAGPGGSDDLEAILHAGSEGRIEVLFLARGAEIRGEYHPESGQIERLNGPTSSESDLLDLAARLTLGRGGQVVTLPAVDFPPGHVAAARFRSS